MEPCCYVTVVANYVYTSISYHQLAQRRRQVTPGVTGNTGGGGGWGVDLDRALLWTAPPFGTLAPLLFLWNGTIPTLCIAAPSRPSASSVSKDAVQLAPSCWAADWLAAALHEG